jgi:hypothetical protein
MRGYYIPLVAGVVLCASAFLPWVNVAGVAMRGVPDIPGLWIAGLGLSATLLASLSLITRKNSRHPLLLVGLVALGILFLSWRILPRSAGDRARTLAQAFAIVEDRPIGEEPVADVGSGIYIGLIAATVIAAFGMTIVVKRAQTPYTIVSADDDVE